VYSGEHYFSDILLGWIYAVMAFYGVRWRSPGSRTAAARSWHACGVAFRPLD